ncbi:MAG: alpha-glucosidase/alpha-galactosidase [Planctomycetota bacterium]|nr:MAG: alpha-glucosidase/alpha-galactosidase [Planctomycetota bacterium]
MSFKIAFIGAGSLGFTRRLIKDTLSVPELQDIEISLMDINTKNLDMIYQLIKKDVKGNELKKIKITKTTSQKKAVTNAKYIFSMFRVGGLEGFKNDIEIPLKYGVDQCVGDTLGPGGIMYGQRGIQIILKLCKDIRENSLPNALLMNYANPIAMLTWAANKFGRVNTIGLCHGVQGGHNMIANAFKMKKEDIDIVCAGINHQTWYIKISHKGKDLTGKLLKAFEAHPEYKKTQKVRLDVLKRFGYFSTESNGHLSEYVPWYRKRGNEIKDWVDLSSWINGETAGYLRVVTENRNQFDTDFPNWIKEPHFKYKYEDRSEEHGSFIIEAMETNRIYRGHFNRINNGIIKNLPNDCVIEAPGYVDRNGLNMPLVGELPLGCAAICNSSISTQRLSVEAAVTGNDELLRQAFMMDPLTGAVCNPPEIWQMVDEMLVHGRSWLPQYKKAITQAQKRLRSGKKIKLKKYISSAKLKIKKTPIKRKLTKAS